MPLILLPLLLAIAQDAPATCPAMPAPLPAALAGWKPGARVAAGTTGAGVPSLALGTRADVALVDATKVRYVLPLTRPATSGSNGGLVAFAVERAGTYEIALGTAAWIDVVGGTGSGTGVSLASSAHAHGPACSGIRKMVDFKLAPGAYVLQISASRDATTGVMVTLLP